ncbi:MAG TPA: hypothetical protein VFI25_03660 [Planctomycetota bacterium]|jgi:hypothetical protein|nr:hypothetical protein [Planctomycetota bacterium]
MRTMAWAWRAACLCALAGAARAQGIDLLFPMETDFIANRGVVRLVDLDADGKFDSCGEAVVDFASLQGSPCGIAQTGSSCANIRDVAYASIGGVPTVFWVRTDTRAVERAADANGNGRLEAAEQSVLFSFSASFLGFNGFVGNCAVDSTGAVWVTTNSSGANQGLYRLRDASGDGVATLGTVVGAEPEVVAFLAGTFTVPDAAGTGTVTLPANNFRACAVDATDHVIAFEATNGVYVSVKDLNGNFAFDAGEAVNFFYPVACLAGLKQNPDMGTLYPNVFDFGTVNSTCLWASGPCAPGAFGNVLRIVHTSVSTTGTPLYWFGSTSAAGFPCYAGIALRGRDLNGNGDLNDAGEVTLFFNGSFQAGPYGTGPTPLVDGGNTIFVNLFEDMGAVGEDLYTFENAGPVPFDNRERLGFGAQMDTVWRFSDGNGDGDADDPGEQVRVGTLTPGEDWGPKGKIVPVPAGAFAVPSSVRISAPGCPAPLSLPPDTDLRGQAGAVGNPSIGNATFAVTLRESPTSGGGVAGPGIGVLVLGSGLFNLDLSLVFPNSIGCTLVPTPDVLVVLPLTLTAAPFTWGSPANSVPVAEATVPIPIPVTPAFVGACLRVQWGIVGFDLALLPEPFLSTAMDVRVGL